MILLLLGRSGCGKNAVASKLIEKHEYKKVISCTTRDSRPGETDRDYHFMSKEKFKTLLAADEFVEYDVYGDNFYGILKSSLISNEMLVCIVTPNGAEAIKKEFPDAFIVYVATDMKTAVLRAIDRENELTPGKIDAISTRACLDYHLFADPKCDLSIENNEGTSLDRIAQDIADAHCEHIACGINNLLRETSNILKESRTELEDYDKKKKGEQ